MTDKIIETIDVTDEESIKKEATIRGEGVRMCPFGLPIPEACENVGDAINRMAPVEQKTAEASVHVAFVDEKAQNEQLVKANNIVYAYHKECKKCPYADKILVNNKKVDCNFGDTAAGRKSMPFIGSPLYPQTFVGIGLDGLYGYPLGFYADNNESRNLFFGLFSMLGSATVEEIIKLAEEYDECGENDKAKIVDTLLEKLQAIKEEYKETFEKVEQYLSDYRLKYETERNDTGLLWELADSWFAPRQINR